MILQIADEKFRLLAQINLNKRNGVKSMERFGKNIKKAFLKRKHKGALYVYIIVLMLVVTMLTAIIATMFDNNLKNAVTQRDNLQLYYYSKAGADWAVNLVQSKASELSASSGGTSLADKLRADATYNVKWTGQGELKAKGNEAGRFSVTIQKVKKRVDSAGQFVSTGGREVDYAKITSVGKALSKDSTGNLVEGKEEYFITVLVSLEALDSVIYMPGER